MSQWPSVSWRQVKICPPSPWCLVLLYLAKSGIHLKLPKPHNALYFSAIISLSRKARLSWLHFMSKDLENSFFCWQWSVPHAVHYLRPELWKNMPWVLRKCADLHVSACHSCWLGNCCHWTKSHWMGDHVNHYMHTYVKRIWICQISEFKIPSLSSDVEKN